MSYLKLTLNPYVHLTFPCLHYDLCVSDIPELAEGPRLTASYKENDTEAQFLCKFERLPRGDVVYRVQFFVDDKEIKTFKDVKGTEENYMMSESEYGDGGYGVKVQGFFYWSLMTFW